ncbi:MAG: phosphonate metabolism protein/1,5-bisphosphokinase (PRPP-forming) PhnN [Pseudomonadota bacterium]
MTDQSTSPAGVLCLVVGPSGAGKDTLLDGARSRLAPTFSFPTRVITRPIDAGGEAHEAVTEACFDALERDGAFALAWRAHGLCYGVRASSLDHLRTGGNVVVNVSRGIIDAARVSYPRVHVFSIRVPEAELRQRLLSRQREDRDAIEARIARATAFRVAGKDVTEIVNDQDPDTGIGRFVAALRSATATP